MWERLRGRSSSEEESKAHNEHPALQAITKAHNNQVDALCVMWMNTFPVKSGISEKWSSKEIVSKHKLDAKLHCKVPFRAYCEAMSTRTSQTQWNQELNWKFVPGQVHVTLDRKEGHTKETHRNANNQ